MTTTAVFVSRLRGLPVVDTTGDQIGKVRDVVVQARTNGRAPRCKGLVVEVFGRRRIFLNIARVQSIDNFQVVITAVLNMRQFTRHDAESLIVDDLFDTKITHRGSPAVIYDISIKPARNRDWEVSEVALSDGRPRAFGRRPHVTIVDWSEISVFSLTTGVRSNDQVLAELEDMHAADVARELHDMSPDRRADIIRALDDERLADAIEELPEDEQVQVIESLGIERAADVLEEMDPDDAADLISELAPDKAEELLQKMQPEDAQDVRRLLVYEESTAGGLMTPEPVLMAPDATVADALAYVRNEELTPALAAMVHVCRTPLEPPTGRYLGSVHIQRLLREPPSTMISELIDTEIEPLPPDAPLPAVSRWFATYNLVSVAVVDENHRLVGAVTVDDVLDHMLPDDWRADDWRGEQKEGH